MHDPGNPQLGEERRDTSGDPTDAPVSPTPWEGGQLEPQHSPGSLP